MCELIINLYRESREKFSVLASFTAFRSVYVVPGGRSEAETEQFE